MHLNSIEISVIRFLMYSYINLLLFVSEIPSNYWSDEVIWILQTYTEAVAQWTRSFASQAEGLVFESQPRQTLVVKTGSDSSTATRSAIGVIVKSHRRWPL